MNVRQYIRADIAASAIAHLSVLALVFVFTEVHPFGVVTAEPIAVDIVRADEIGAKVESDPQPQLPSPDVVAGNKEAQSAAQPPAPAAAQAENVPSSPQQHPAPQSRKEAALQQKQQEQKQQEQKQQEQKQEQQKQQAKPQAAQPPPEAQPQPQAEQQVPPPPPQPAPSPSLGYTPPEPDITVKYHVMLGLPEDMPVTLPKSPGDTNSDKSGDGGDANASTKADVSSSVIEQFRRHLKTCSKLPDSIAPTDKVKVKLRIVMTPQGRLATNPILMEASASAKGPLLMQGAIAALNACQPYSMLPPDRYGEWKVIDLSFTPDDFSS